MWRIFCYGPFGQKYVILDVAKQSDYIRNLCLSSQDLRSVHTAYLCVTYRLHKGLGHQTSISPLLCPHVQVHAYRYECRVAVVAESKLSFLISCSSLSTVTSTLPIETLLRVVAPIIIASWLSGDFFNFIIFIFGKTMIL